MPKTEKLDFTEKQYFVSQKEVDQRLLEETFWAADAYVDHYVGMIRDGITFLKFTIMLKDTKNASPLALNLKIQIKDFRFLIRDIVDDDLKYQRIVEKFNTWETKLDSLIFDLSLMVDDKMSHEKMFDSIK